MKFGARVPRRQTLNMARFKDACREGLLIRDLAARFRLTVAEATRRRSKALAGFRTRRMFP